MSLQSIAPTLPARPDVGHAFLDGILAFIWFLLSIVRAVVILAIVALVIGGIVITAVIIWSFLKEQFQTHPRRSFSISGGVLLLALYVSGALAIPAVQWIGGVLISIGLTVYVLIKVVKRAL